MIRESLIPTSLKAAFTGGSSLAVMFLCQMSASSPVG